MRTREERDGALGLAHVRHSDVGVFFSESIRSLSVTASLFPSSHRLACALLRFVDFREARWIVELGIGTGAVTAEILRRMRPDATLYAIDINPTFVSHIRGKIRDRRLEPILGRAEDLESIIRGRRIWRLDAVISSLGLSTMNESQRRHIIGQAARHLSPSGVLSQFQYIHASGEPNWLGRVGLRRFPEERFLRQYFHNVKSECIILNLPPAKVFTCCF